jgi:hypothetical protein
MKIIELQEIISEVCNTVKQNNKKFLVFKG